MKTKRDIAEIHVNRFDANQKFVKRSTLRKHAEPKTRAERKETARAIDFEAKRAPLTSKERRKLQRKATQALRKHGKL